MEFSFQGPAGLLEAALWVPKGEPRAAVVCCHPHPLHGGTMRSTACFRTARGLQTAGLAVLRFNFRGVGRSAGEHDGRGGEVEDARAGLDELARRFPGLELWAAGFSFGARTVAALAQDEPRVARLVLVALPVVAYDLSELDTLPGPGFAIMAEDDAFGTLATLRERLPGLASRFETDQIAAADHYFSGRAHELQQRVADYARRHAPLAAPRPTPTNGGA